MKRLTTKKIQNEAHRRVLMNKIQRMFRTRMKLDAKLARMDKAIADAIKNHDVDPTNFN